MVKTGLDNINLSKMCPTFIGGTDRTCEAFNNYLDMETVQVPFYNNFFPPGTNICQTSIDKIGWSRL